LVNSRVPVSPTTIFVATSGLAIKVSSSSAETAHATVALEVGQKVQSGYLLVEFA
jgi:hypothetical protein